MVKGRIKMVHYNIGDIIFQLVYILILIILGVFVAQFLYRLNKKKIVFIASSNWGP